MDIRELDYSDHLEIADGVYWVGFADAEAGFHCNPYLIVDRDEAVLIDSGSRNDFSTVMLKIMRTGVNPNNIKRLIYQHYDPDLCGNIPHMEAMIDNEELKIISHHDNNVFIHYYSVKSPMLCIEDLGFAFTFASGRRLEFTRTPYSHSPGSFITYDTHTKVLFTGDLFGSYDADWSLYSRVIEGCARCEPSADCAYSGKPCQIMGLWRFHRQVMTSTKALRYALGIIGEMDVSMIAPQHGSVLHTPLARGIVMERLKALEGVGIDGYISGGEAHG
ncbi:MAG: MBL fold metallo-hydrolase [Clostridiales bacterium]|nr:MBL fold metallo-hydrolase [Clostridiales bacterium]